MVEIEGYSEEWQKVPHDRSTKLEYRSAWARTYLKKIGLITNSGIGVWAITEKGEKTSPDTILKEIRDFYKNKSRSASDNNKKESNLEEKPDEDLEEDDWKTALLKVLTKIDPSAFERLSQRLLRESGFVKVQVTGKTGDGGIDGIGVLRINLISFHVFFQCKRYVGSVGAGAIRDFRGAMTGRGDKGLVITTGSFTSDARKEASRDGAPVIDLIDGEELCELLKRLKLGTHVEIVENVTFDRDFFEAI
jgi:restriction system protein